MSVEEITFPGYARAERGRAPGPSARWPAYDRGVDFSFAFTPDLIAVFLTLFVLEIVLGVDNVIFISILASKLPKEQQARARNLGLTLAMLIRVMLCSSRAGSSR